MADDASPAPGALLIVGGGRMGEALATGLLTHGWPAESLVVVEAQAGRREELSRGHRDLQVTATVADALAGSLAGPLAGGGSGRTGHSGKGESTEAAAAPAGPDAAAAAVEPDAAAAAVEPDAAAAAVGAATAEEAAANPTEILGAVIAVKPHDVVGVCRTLQGAAVGRVLSIAAGVTLAAMEGALPDAAVLRAMPNTPALVGAGAAAVSPGSRAGAADVAWARTILESIGTVVELPEPALDAVTGLSGSGPAYVFLVAEALIDAGVLAGLTRPVARELAVQTLLGSARLLAETGDEAPALRAAVTSPGGTTAAGLRVLEAAGVRSAFLEAVMAATERARELGRPH